MFKEIRRLKQELEDLKIRLDAYKKEGKENFSHASDRRALLQKDLSSLQFKLVKLEDKFRKELMRLEEKVDILAQENPQRCELCKKIVFKTFYLGLSTPKHATLIVKDSPHWIRDIITICENCKEKSINELSVQYYSRRENKQC